MVVTNGWREDKQGLRRCYRDMTEFRQDPLRSLQTENWLASCGGTYRTAKVGVEYFDGQTRYLEWTTTAYRCALELNIHFLDKPTFRICETEGSLSKSDAYGRGVVRALTVIAALDLPQDVRATILRKRCDALHDLAERYRLAGAIGAAWIWHFRCLVQRSGPRYWRYTARLLLSSFGALLQP